MRRFPVVFSSALVLSSSLMVQAQPSEAEAKALASMYSVSVIGSFVRDWCFARAPQTKMAVNAGFNGWRQDTKLDVIEKTLTALSAEAVKSLQTNLEPGRAKMYAELDKAAKNPAQECLGIRTYLNQQLNPQKMYPDAYAAALQVRVQASSPASKPTTGQATPTPAVQGSTTLADEYELPRGSRVGGSLVFGTYNCSRAKNNEKAVPRGAFHIYPKDEYRRVYSDKAPTYDMDFGNKNNASFYKYDPKTGLLDLYDDDDFSNSEFRMERGQFGIYYTDPAGRPVLYAEDDYGLGIYITTCIYAGANKYPAPSQIKAQQAKAEADKAAAQERERNRYRTAPNAGLKLSQIKALIHSYKSNYDGQNTKVQEDVTLLLNDGTAYLNLQYTPHDLNAKASKAGEPKNWTRWRSVGGSYQILEGGKWVKLEGHEVKPFGQNERLSGAYSYKSYYQVGYFDNASVSYSESNYYFSQNGTFDRGGMARTTGGTDMGGIKTSGVAQTSNPDTSGTYTLSGYTLQLKYNDGTVLRPFAFYWGSDKKRLIIGGTTYSR